MMDVEGEAAAAGAMDEGADEDQQAAAMEEEELHGPGGEGQDEEADEDEDEDEEDEELMLELPEETQCVRFRNYEPVHAALRRQLKPGARVPDVGAAIEERLQRLLTTPQEVSREEGGW